MFTDKYTDKYCHFRNCPIFFSTKSRQNYNNVTKEK